MTSKFPENTKKRVWVNLAAKLFFVLIIVFVADFMIGSLLETYYFKQKAGPNSLTTYTMETTRAELLVLGSSRASHHYIPDVFEKELHLTCYNGGRDGAPVFYEYALLKSALKRYTPKAVILDLAWGDFEKTQISYDRLSILLPYYKQHPEIRSIVEMKGPFEKFKLLSRIYPYNSLAIGIFTNQTDYNVKKNLENKGYVSLANKMDTVDQKYKTPPLTYQIDKEKVVVFESFIKDCIHAGTKLFIIASPYYYETEGEDISVTIGKKIAAKYNVPFLNFRNDTNYIKKTYLFNEPVHLNDAGARKFSSALCQYIQSAKYFGVK